MTPVNKETLEMLIDELSYCKNKKINKEIRAELINEALERYQREVDIYQESKEEATSTIVISMQIEINELDTFKKEIEVIDFMYGLDKLNNTDIIEFNNKTYIGWYINGYDTIKDLRKEYPSDYYIQKFYKIDV